MQPIHLAIGVVEGIVTAAVVLFVLRAQPELLAREAARTSLAGVRLKPVLVALAVAALVVGGALSWFASADEDGLEWSISRVIGSGQELGGTGATHDAAAGLQERIAVLPDYAFPGGGKEADAAAGGSEAAGAGGGPAVDAGTSVSGVVGALLVLAIAGAVGFALRRRSAARAESST
jgi:cobalt/nickel transport system permease protein